MLNGSPIAARSSAPLSPGDRVEFADEMALYHRELRELWRDELRHRLLAGIVKLHQALPQDQIRKAFGREEIQSAVTEARVNGETGAAELEHSVPLDSEGGFPAESAAFVGGVDVVDGVLELSLWTIAAGAITLGVMQQIMRAFDRVEVSFQFLVNSWGTIVELLSIYKRLNAFEKQFKALAAEGRGDVGGDIGGGGMGGSEGGIGANA